MSEGWHDLGPSGHDIDVMYDYFDALEDNARSARELAEIFQKRRTTFVQMGVGSNPKRSRQRRPPPPVMTKGFLFDALMEIKG